MTFKSCRAKRRYRDWSTAQRALTASRRKGGQAPTRVYDCPECGGWHLTGAPAVSPRRPVEKPISRQWSAQDAERFAWLQRAHKGETA